MRRVVAGAAGPPSWSGPHCWVPVRTRRTARGPSGPIATLLAGPIAASPKRWRTPSIARLASLQRPGRADARAGRRRGRRSAAARPARRTSRPRARAGGRRRPRSISVDQRGHGGDDGLGRVDGADDRGRPGRGARTTPSRTFSVNVRPAVPCGPQAGGHGVGQPDQLAADVGEVVEVVGERLLVADRLGLPLDLDRTVVDDRRRGRAGGGRGPGRGAEITATGSSAARSPTVDTPIRRSRSSVAGPTPHSRSDGQRVEVGQLLPRADLETRRARAARRRAWPAAWRRPTPAWPGTCSGRPRPSSVSSSCSATSARNRRAIVTPSPSRARAPVTSRNASSRASGSISGVTPAKMAWTSRLAAAYAAWSPGRNTADGHRRRAVADGSAEWTP